MLTATVSSFTHSWSMLNQRQFHLQMLENAKFCVVSSALESGIRGSVQLLLELGLVDEAKAITEKFMARWISI